MRNIQMYCLCLHNRIFPIINKLGYIPVGLGNENFSKEWLRDNTLENISYKNKYYGEYTFHYWFWKNQLPKIADNSWIGFCAYREFWGNKKKVEKNSKINEVVLNKIPEEWNNYDSIIGEHIFVNNLPLMKLFKKGIPALINNPKAILKKNRNIRFHFDMMHGVGNLDKAIDLLDKKDREDFRKYTRTNFSFSRGNMFICRSKRIIEEYYKSIFMWLKNCENIFGFNLNGYGMTRIYAFLAERYISYWFDKYTNSLKWPVVFFDSSKINQ